MTEVWFSKVGLITFVEGLLEKQSVEMYDCNRAGLGAGSGIMTRLT
jgi:hypothetical protein